MTNCWTSGYLRRSCSMWSS